MRIFLHKETTECQNFAISVTLCIGGNERGGSHFVSNDGELIRKPLSWSFPHMNLVLRVFHQ